MQCHALDKRKHKTTKKRLTLTFQYNVFTCKLKHQKKKENSAMALLDSKQKKKTQATQHKTN